MHSRPTTAASNASSSKTRLEHEVKFRAAAIQVAWGAEALCHSTTQIEPFVLLSSHAMQLKLSAAVT